MAARSPQYPPTLFNRCNVLPWVIGAREFQDDPRPVEIDGVRAADRRLFERLAAMADPAARGEFFHDYVSVKFRLHEWGEHDATARESLRSTYIRYLCNWGADSNGHAGAVLKSWVESRFGLPATFHTGVLADEEARARYRHDQMRGAAQTVGAMMQLDLLYTFCQDELARRFPGERWRTLYRGTHDPDEYALQPDSGGTRGRPVWVQLNNLSSFTADRETAWEFGSAVWEVRVPLAKIVFFSGLLPRHLLHGESEHLVLGGEYRVQPLRW